MRRITGAAALAYVVLAAIENMELLGMPRLGGSPAAIEAAYADTALGVVTVSAGALSLLCYAAFAAALLRLGGASWRWLAPAVLGAGLAGTGVAAAAQLVAGGDTGLFDLQLQLRYLAGPLMALFLIGAGRAGVLPPVLSRSAVVVAAPLVLSPLALTESASLQLLAQLAFAAQAAWIWLAGLWLACGGPGLVRRSAFLMLVLAAGLVGVALLAVPDATGVFFAWGLGPDSLAAFAGGVYVASAAVYAVALQAPAREAHGLVVAAVVLSVSVLASTLGHLDVFDFGRLQAWAWVALFVAFGIATTVLALHGPWWAAAAGVGATAPGRRGRAAGRHRPHAVDRSGRLLARPARRALRGLVGRHARHAGVVRGAREPSPRGTAAGAGAHDPPGGRARRRRAHRRAARLPDRTRAAGCRRSGDPRGQRGTGWRGS
jgi:hypothetical protein